MFLSLLTAQILFCNSIPAPQPHLGGPAAPANKCLFQTPKGQKPLWRHTDLFSWFLHFLGSLSTGEKHWWAAAPLGTYRNEIQKQHRDMHSQDQVLSSNTEHSPAGLGSCQGNGWFASPHTAVSTPKPGSQKSQKSTGKPGQVHRVLKPPASLHWLQRDQLKHSYTGDSSQRSSCFPPPVSCLGIMWDIGICHSYSKQCGWEAYRQNFRQRQLLTRNKDLPIFLPKAHYRVTTWRGNCVIPGQDFSC